MKATIQSIKPEGDFNDNNVYSITLDNGTTAKCYAKKDSYKDKRFADGTAIGKEMEYELTAKGNFGSVRIGNAGNFSSSTNGSSYSKSSSDNRQQSIVRQSMLKAACTFLAGKPNIKSEHIFKLAETFVEWVDRVEEAKPVPPTQHLDRTSNQSDELPPVPSMETVAESVVVVDGEGLPF